MTTTSASILLGDALDLRHRHPRLWARVQAGEIADWQARKVARLAAELSWERARQVDAATTDLLGNLPWTWAVEIAERLPGTSAISLIFGGGPSETLSDGQARTTLLAWAAVLLVAGGWRLVRTDANR